MISSEKFYLVSHQNRKISSNAAIISTNKSTIRFQGNMTHLILLNSRHLLDVLKLDLQLCLLESKKNTFIH